ncbi:23881_t:CDS:2, partial [Racocetra persica]
DICEIYLGGHRRIVISRPEYLENMLTPSATDTTFMTRALYSKELEEFGMAGRGVIFNHDVKSWRFNRQLLNKAILSPSFNIEAVKWIDMIFQELEGYWNSLANISKCCDISQDNKNSWLLETDLSLWTHRFANDIIVVLTTGERTYAMVSLYNKLDPIKVNHSDALIEDSERFIQGISKHVLGFSLFSFLNSSILHNIPFIKSNVKSIVENRDYMFKKIDAIIKRKRKEVEVMLIEKEFKHELLTSLIITNTEMDTDNVKTVGNRPMTDVEIRGILLDTFLARTKTKMIAEIDSIFPQNTCLNHNGLLKLDYCTAIIKEVDRIMPASNILSRYTNNPCEIAGYKWNTGTVFHVNLNGIHKHKDHWSNSEIFDPDRFYKKDDKLDRYKFSFAMFGGGLRICPGRKLAIIKVLSLMVLIYRKYDIELVDSKAPLKTTIALVTVCEELLIRIKHRN